MEVLITLMPTIFAYWTGILIVWSSVTIIGLSHIMYTIHKRNQIIRTTDIYALVGTIVGLSCMVCALFIIPGAALLLVDVMIGLDIWFSLVLAYISSRQLVYWPLVVSKNFSRHSRTGNTNLYNLLVSKRGHHSKHP